LCFWHFVNFLVAGWAVWRGPSSASTGFPSAARHFGELPGKTVKNENRWNYLIVSANRWNYF
jgi:hypothetical protein